MSGTIVKRAFAALKNNAVQIVGVTIFGEIIAALGASLFVGIPAISIAIGLLVEASLAAILLRAFKGEEINCKQVFDSVKDWETAKHVLGGMGWMSLWVFLWGLIPVVGWVFAIIRSYEYRLTPFILMNEPEIPACDAIKVSKERTNGYKGSMFGTDVILALLVLAALIICIIPFIGWITFVAAAFAISALFGLASAAYYEEINNPTPAAAPAYYSAPAQANYAPVNTPVVFCPECGTKNVANAKFCCGCGYKFGTVEETPAAIPEPVFPVFESEFKVAVQGETKQENE